ncbi:uncharacterized protein [Diadema antillarum]|uniref:uncharacterized protein n=1 Tax=Diadema antillarum TaxID=105358 RepID=UPI003A863DD5
MPTDTELNSTQAELSEMATKSAVQFSPMSKFKPVPWGPGLPEAALGPNSEAVNIASQISNMHLKGDVASSQVQLGSQVPTDHVASDPRALPQEWMALQQQQQLQQHMLFAQFKERQTQLAQQHQKQQQELIMVGYHWDDLYRKVKAIRLHRGTCFGYHTCE